MYCFATLIQTEAAIEIQYRSTFELFVDHFSIKSGILSFRSAKSQEVQEVPLSVKETLILRSSWTSPQFTFLLDARPFNFHISLTT